MARYYLHLRDGVDIVLDEEGSEYADIELLKKAVMRNARDIMSGDVKASGMLDLRFRIDAETWAERSFTRFRLVRPSTSSRSRAVSAKIPHQTHPAPLVQPSPARRPFGTFLIIIRQRPERDPHRKLHYRMIGAHSVRLPHPQIGGAAQVSLSVLFADAMKPKRP